MSICLNDGPSICPTVAVPARSSGGLVKAAVLNQLELVAVDVDLGARVVGAPVANRRVARGREVLARLVAVLAADLPAAGDGLEHAAVIAQPRQPIGQRVHEGVATVEGGGTVQVVEVADRLRRIVVAVAAGVGERLAERVGHRELEVAAALGRIQLHRVVGGVGVADPHADRRVAGVGPQGVHRHPLRRRQRGIGAQRVERRAVDVRLADQVLAAVADVGGLDEVAAAELTLHADAEVHLRRQLHVRVERVDVANRGDRAGGAAASAR